MFGKKYVIYLWKLAGPAKEQNEKALARTVSSFFCKTFCKIFVKCVIQNLCYLSQKIKKFQEFSQNTKIRISKTKNTIFEKHFFER